MSWGARAGRAAALCLLAVSWGAAGHDLRALTHPGAVGALLWVLLALLLPTWWVAGARPESRAGRGLLIGALLAVGQGLTHGALALAPLLGRAPSAAVPGSDHGHGVGPGAALPGHEVLAVLTQGGAPMLLSHVVAALLAGTCWAVASALHATALRVWGLLRWAPVVPPLPHRAPSSARTVLRCAEPAHPCAVRGPPLRAA